MGLVARKSDQMIIGLKLLTPVVTSRVGRGARDGVWSLMANDLIMMKPSQKTRRSRFGELPNWWPYIGTGRMGNSESIEAPCLFPIPCPMYFFHLAVPDFYLLIGNW